MSNPPEASIWLSIPDTCRIQGSFTGDLDIQITFGGPIYGRDVLFERAALERFVKLASDLLTVPLSKDHRADLPVLVV